MAKKYIFNQYVFYFFFYFFIYYSVACNIFKNWELEGKPFIFKFWTFPPKYFTIEKFQIKTGNILNHFLR